MIYFKHIGQSCWLGGYLNEFFPEKGTFVEIGVGNIIAHDYVSNPEPWQKMHWKDLPILGSNTIELLQNGWNGHYIDPEEKFLDQAKLLSPTSDKIKTLAVGCGSTFSKGTLGVGESFLNPDINSNLPWIGKKHQIVPTREAFYRLDVPESFDFLSIDVEGYEIEVLDGLINSPYKAKAIIIETNHVGLMSVMSHPYISSYKLVRHDNLNALLIKNESST